MKSKVYFSQDIGKVVSKVLPAKVSGKVALKVHFGERGNITFVKPEFVKEVYENILERGGKADLVESNVLYKGSRTETADHLRIASEHGFDFAPVKILDDKDKGWEIAIKEKGKHFSSVKIGAGLKDYSGLISVAHFKGHGASGFGGAFKNIGMGLGSRSGKLEMHSAFKLYIDEKCTACRTCIEHCPADAIRIVGKKAEIDCETCIGCAKCIAVCPSNAVRIPWEAGWADIQEKIVEYCYGVLKKVPGIGYFNVLKNITKDCDCAGCEMEPVLEDIGFLGSRDVVALEQASFDLVCEKFGKDLFKGLHGVDGTVQLKYAEKLGLGSREYELVKV